MCYLILKGDLESSLGTMHDKMRDLALRRQQRSTVRQKTKWALYEKRYFDRLISDVVQIVEGLIDGFPATKQRQSELVVEEVQENESQSALAEIETAAEGVDSLLVSSIQRTLAAQSRHNFTGNSVTGEAKVQYGDQYVRAAQHTGPGHSYSGNTASERARTQYGNMYL